MNRNIVKIGDYGSYLVDYKLVAPNEFRIVLNPELEEAGVFDEDDYIIRLCRELWFKQVELIPAGVVEEPDTLDQVTHQQYEVFDWV